MGWGHLEVGTCSNEQFLLNVCFNFLSMSIFALVFSPNIQTGSKCGDRTHKNEDLVCVRGKL